MINQIIILRTSRWETIQLATSLVEIQWLIQKESKEGTTGGFRKESIGSITEYWK